MKILSMCNVQLDSRIRLMVFLIQLSRPSASPRLRRGVVRAEAKLSYLTTHKSQTNHSHQAEKPLSMRLSFPRSCPNNPARDRAEALTTWSLVSQ